MRRNLIWSKQKQVKLNSSSFIFSLCLFLSLFLSYLLCSNFASPSNESFYLRRESRSRISWEVCNLHRRSLKSAWLARVLGASSPVNLDMPDYRVLACKQCDLVYIHDSIFLIIRGKERSLWIWHSLAIHCTDPGLIIAQENGEDN